MSTTEQISLIKSTAEDSEDAGTKSAAPAARRRKASRAAGPAGKAEPVAVKKAEPAPAKKTSAKRASDSKRGAKRKGPPPRRLPNRRLVTLIAYPVLAVALVAVAMVTSLLYVADSRAEAERAREQRFVDTAVQTVVNMYSYTPDTIDQSVNRFVEGTSGPLRDMLSINNNVESLKAMYRDTNATSEAVVKAAALEAIDEVSKNASVLVSVRVTVTDIDSVNRPSQAYRVRVIVREDDNGHMTSYDLKYPDGGN